MTETPALAPRPKRKRRIALVAGVVVAASGAAAALGPAAPWIIDSAADGVRVWRLGRIDIDGVTGTWIGDLNAARITLADEDGAWLAADNVSLAWRPFDLLVGGVRVDRARAETVTLLRQPNLTESRPSRGSGLNVRLSEVEIGDLHITEAAFGEDAHFGATLELGVRDKALADLDLALRRLDSDADRAIVQYRVNGVFTLLADIEGEPGGVIARALGGPDDHVLITAQGNGVPADGEARFSGRLGQAELFGGDIRWTPTRWSLDTTARLDLLAATDDLARRIGPTLALNASGAPRGAFTAHAETPFLALDLGGVLNEDMDLDGPAHFTASTRRLSDIAREAPFEFGLASLSGELRRANGTTAIRGDLDARELNVLGQTVRMSGPVEAALTPERFTLRGDLRAPDNTPPLFENARLLTELEYDRGRGRFALQRARLDGAVIALDAQGWTNRGDGEFTGDWQVRRLDTFARDLRGAARGRWRARALPGEENPRIWSVTLDGVGAGIAGAPDIAPQLLGAAPRLDALIRYENGGLTVSHARIDGSRLRAGASGRIVGGEANLQLEATARGPFTIGAAEISGAADATGRLTGRLARPTLTATTQLAAFSVSGVIIEQPLLGITLAPTGQAYRGHAEVRGAISGQALIAAADVGVSGTILDFDSLAIQAGQLQANGRATLTPRGVEGRLIYAGALDGLAPGVSGEVEGDAALTPDAIALTARIANARAGELYLRAATVTAAGPYRAIEAQYDVRGRLRRAPLRLAGEALLSARDGVMELRLQGEGALANANIATRAPITMTWSESGVEGALDVRISDGALAAQWRERGRAVSGSATIENAPLAPLAAIWNETASGRISGRVTLADSGRGLAGDADVTLVGARFAGRQRGTLDMHIVGTLEPNRVRAEIDARSTEGLVARFEADAPVTTNSDPIRIALTPDRRGRATWSVRGPAESLWAAARLQDQALSGELDGQGEISFGAGSLSGDGRIAIINGRFEDKLTGITLVDLDAEVSIGSRGVNIERFTATSPGGGRLVATGGSADPSQGRIAVTVENMLVANRPDARARGSGELTLAWEGMHSTLSGALDVAEADVRIAQNPEAGIPTLDVIEINRPDQEDDDPNLITLERNGSTEIDVRVRAPGRVFTRGRGVDAEWALDLRLAGTGAHPRVFGEARAVRGTLSLSGQPFEIETGRITFNGDPLDARLDLRAERSTADLTARIILSGTASNPDISLTSSPPLPEDEILPQVLFGRSVADLSGLEAAQIASALASLSGRASFDLVDAARAAAGLDRFNVRQDEGGGFLVSGGVYLTRDVYVELGRTGLGQAQTRVEWTIRPRLVLITSFLASGDQRASIRWRRETD